MNMYVRSGVSGVLRVLALCAAFGAVSPLLSRAPAAADEAGGIRVGYHFTPAAPEHYKVEFSQEYEVKGYSFSTLVDLEYTETCVDAVHDSLFSMEITITKVSAQMKRNDDLMDSGIDEEMTDQTFAFEIDRNGMISGIHAKKYLESEDEILNILRVVLGGGYPYLPDSVMSVGGEWSFEGSTLKDLKSDMKIESDSRFKIEGLKKESGRECIQVKRSGKQYISGRIENQGGTYVVDGQGEGSTEFFFDAAAGCIVKLKSETTAEITYIDASGSSAGERESQTSNISYNLKKELK
jgi:hypothetical protein